MQTREQRAAYAKRRDKNRNMVVVALYGDADTLRALARKRKVSVAEIVRTYVAWGLEQDGVKD